MQLNEAVSARLKELLRERNMTQYQLYMKSGVPKSSIGNIVNCAYDSVKLRVIHEICQAVEPDTVNVDRNLALIAVVGCGMVKAKGTALRIFRAVSNADINIRMIDQGSSELNIILGVDESDFETALRAIYQEFAENNVIK